MRAFTAAGQLAPGAPQVRLSHERVGGARCRSLVQQSIGGGASGHGFLVWEFGPPGAEPSCRSVDVPNDRGFLRFEARATPGAPGGALLWASGRPLGRASTPAEAHDLVAAQPALPAHPYYFEITHEAGLHELTVERLVGGLVALYGFGPRAVRRS